MIGNEPFAVLLGDNIVQAETSCLKQMINQYNQYKASVIGVQHVPEEEVSCYEIVYGKEIYARFYSVSYLIEKLKK